VARRSSPTLDGTMSYAVDQRNRDFVNFAAAFLGHISANVRAVYVAADAPSQFEVLVFLHAESSKDRESVREALKDFEAMRQPPYDVPFEVRCDFKVSAESIKHPDQSRFLGLYRAFEQ